MNRTLEYIGKKFDIDVTLKPPIEIQKINRTIMAQTLAELDLKVGVEVGVARGDHSLILCQNIPGLKLYGVDAWKNYRGYEEYDENMELYRQQAMEKLKPYDVTLIRKFSMEAVEMFTIGELDFVYIDAAHDFKHVAEDVFEWSRKVRIGGIVFGHDFERKNPPKNKFAVHVKDVISSYTYALGVRPWFILGMDGVHRDGSFKEGVRSWMFVRQEDDLIWLV